MEQLIVTCDDCGLSEGINLAAVELYEKGIATSFSVMMNFPASQHAAQLFSRYPLLDIGIHLNLTDGTPISEIPSPSKLTDSSGRFRSKHSVYTHALLPTRSFLASVRQELRAQMDCFIEQFGKRPYHITTHSHFHTLRSLSNIIGELAEEYGIVWVRTSTPRAAVLPFNPVFQPSYPHQANNYIVGLRFWLNHDPHQLMKKLLALRHKTEIVVHPCLHSDATYPEGIYYLPHERHTEMVYLEKLFALIRDDAKLRIQPFMGTD
jgi:predicted glycoside hydrolase/deacetylase ChbG (UPF0249 family)